MSAMYAHIGHDMLASSASLLTTRVAGAAARHRLGIDLTESDVEAVKTMLTVLRSEVSVLSGEREASVRDESAYAVTGFALGEIARDGIGEVDELTAAASLAELAGSLERLLSRETSASEVLMIEQVFLATGRQASLGLSGTGEALPGPSLVLAY
jgi:hypothetical protein